MSDPIKRIREALAIGMWDVQRHRDLTALLDRLDTADEMRDVLLRNGFVECDIPACNCGSWHHRYGLPERMREIEDALSEAGHEMSNENGHSILRALNALIARLDAAEREIERLRKDAERYRWLRGREDGRYLTVYAFRTDIDEVCLGDELDAAIDTARREK